MAAMNDYSGGDFDNFLTEEGILEEVSARAYKRLLALKVEDVVGDIRQDALPKPRHPFTQATLDPVIDSLPHEGEPQAIEEMETAIGQAIRESEADRG